MATRVIARLYDSRDSAIQVVRDLEQAGIPHDDISLIAREGDVAAATGTAPAGTLAPAATDPTATDLGAPGIGTPGLGTPGFGAPAYGADIASSAAVPGLTAADTAAPAYVPAHEAGTTEAEHHAASGAGAGASIGTIIGGGLGLVAGIGALAIPGVGPVVAAGWLVATITGAGIGAAGGGIVGSLTGAGVSEEEAHVYTEGVRRGGTLVSVRVDEAQAERVSDVMRRHSPVDWETRREEYRTGGWTGFSETDSALDPQLDADRRGPPVERTPIDRL